MATENLEERANSMRDVLRARLSAMGISAREASRRAGFNVGYVGDFLEGRSKMPEAKRIVKLAQALELDVDHIVPKHFAGMQFDNLMLATPEQNRRANRPTGLPLHAARVASSRKALLDIQPVHGEYVESVPGISTPGAFAVTVPNDMNEPRYMAGDLAIVSPAASIRPGDFVFVRVVDGTAGIFRLTEIDDDDMVQLITLSGETAKASIAQEDVYKVVAAIAG